MGVTERGIIKKIVNDENPVIVYNMKVIKLSFACSEFSVHAQNQRQTGSFVRTKVWVFAQRAIFLCTCSKIYGSQMIPLA